MRRRNHGSVYAVGRRRYVSTVGPTMCLGGKKLTGRKKNYGQPENQHRDPVTWSQAAESFLPQCRCWRPKKRQYVLFSIFSFARVTGGFFECF